MSEPELRPLSLNQRKALQAEIGYLFQPFRDHQGWPSLAAADTATRRVEEIFRKLGVRA